MCSIGAFLSGDISVLQERLDLACSKYDSLYVSIGGKYNQPAVSFHNPSYLASNQYPTNSSFQMVPEFLRSWPTSASSRVLVIVVDVFDTEEIRQANTSIVSKLSSQFPHIDVVLYHKKLHLDDVPSPQRSSSSYKPATFHPPKSCFVISSGFEVVPVSMQRNSRPNYHAYSKKHSTPTAGPMRIAYTNGSATNFTSTIWSIPTKNTTTNDTCRSCGY